MFLLRQLTCPKRALRALAVVILGMAMGACASRGRFEGMSPQALHVQAQQEFDNGDYEQAIETLDRLLLVFPDYPQIADARYLLARTYYEDEQYLLASDEFMRFLERHSGSLLAPEAAMGVCRSYVALSPIPPRDQTYTRQAFSVCQDVSRQYPNSQAAQDAAQLALQMRSKLAEKQFETGQHFFDRDQLDSATIYWELLLTDYADTEWAPRALKGLYCAWRQIGYQDYADDAQLRLLNAYPESGEARQARDGGLTC